MPLLLAVPAAADWLVYLGGGIEEVRDGWEVRGPMVQFHALNGTLLAVRASEIDLATSAFLSWQVGERRAIRTDHPPAGAELRPAAPTGQSRGQAACLPARVVQVLSAETLEIESGGRTETVHLACIDAPERQHRYPEFARFGDQAATATGAALGPRGEVCVANESPPLVDRQRHRIVYVNLPSGRDLGEELLARGLVLARSGDCARRERYQATERLALQGEVGHWGGGGLELATDVLAHLAGFRGGPGAGGGRRS